VRSRLAATGVAVELVIVESAGDRDRATPAARLGTGIFTKELEEALKRRDIDAAVHSLKDLPSAILPGLSLAAVPEREDPRDAVIGRPLGDLPAGARVGASSPRRTGWIRRSWEWLQTVPVRGNVDTRIRKLDAGEFDALVLALAGIRRLGMEDRVAAILAVDDLVPPAGQGALGVETREGEEGLVADIDDLALRRGVEAERALYRELRAGCRTPLGAYAPAAAGPLTLRADLGGIRAEATGSDPESVARDVAGRLLAAGGGRFLR
jgi:hydroxymethylbilane synthase